MILAIVKTNCSSSVVALFGWEIKCEESCSVHYRIMEYAEDNLPPTEHPGVYRAGNVLVAVALSNCDVAIGHMGKMEATSEFVRQLLSGMLDVLRSVCGEIKVKRLPGRDGEVIYKDGVVRVSSPALVVFSAGNEGDGVQTVLTGIKRIGSGRIPLPL